jgi:ribonucleoside-triphosphate reductase
VLCLFLFLDGVTLGLFTTPLLLQYGKFHPAWAVALCGGLASAAGSALQLRLLRWALDANVSWLRRLAPSRERLAEALRQVPSASFLAIMLARATPLPDGPIKLVAAAARYPIPRYVLALFLGALPYYFALAYLGSRLRVPGWILFTGAIVLVLLGVLFDRLRRGRRPA